jgi:hypothetical protein
MNPDQENRIRQLLKQALPPVPEISPGPDLWPAMRGRLDTRPAPPPWFDWALAGGLAVFAAVFPSMIPVFLYYL